MNMIRFLACISFLVAIALSQDTSPCIGFGMFVVLLDVALTVMIVEVDVIVVDVILMLMFDVIEGCDLVDVKCADWILV